MFSVHGANCAHLIFFLLHLLLCVECLNDCVFVFIAKYGFPVPLFRKLFIAFDAQCGSVDV